MFSFTCNSFTDFCIIEGSITEVQLKIVIYIIDISHLWYWGKSNNLV